MKYKLEEQSAYTVDFTFTTSTFLQSLLLFAPIYKSILKQEMFSFIKIKILTFSQPVVLSDSLKRADSGSAGISVDSVL